MTIQKSPQIPPNDELSNAIDQRCLYILVGRHQTTKAICYSFYVSEGSSSAYTIHAELCPVDKTPNYFQKITSPSPKAAANSSLGIAMKIADVEDVLRGQLGIRIQYVDIKPKGPHGKVTTRDWAARALAALENEGYIDLENHPEIMLDEAECALTKSEAAGSGDQLLVITCSSYRYRPHP